MNEEGTESLLGSDAAKKVYDVYRGLVEDGIVAPGTKDEAGPTWTGVFPKGNVGIMPMPSTTLGLMPKNLDVGVAPIRGLDGGDSTFVGGDGIGISANSEKADQAWNFLAWSLSDEAQVEVVAKNKDVVARTDLASNKYSDEDPRLVAINEVAAKGVTPFALKFGQTFNDPQRSLAATVRDAVFGDAGKVDADNEAVTASLARVTAPSHAKPQRATGQPDDAEGTEGSGRSASPARPPWWRARRVKGFAYALPGLVFIVVFFIVPLLLVGQMSASDWPLLGGNRGSTCPTTTPSIADNPLFWPAVRFTLKYTGIVVAALLGLALLLALLVQEASAGRGLLPYGLLPAGALGLASASLLFWGFYSPTIGPLAALLRWLGLIDEAISWLGSPTMALLSTVFLVVWKFAGFYMLVLLVGLQGIPTDVYEAARMDGASRVADVPRTSRSRCCARPSRWPVDPAVTGSLLAFDQFFILTKGGPDNSTVTVVQLIYREAFFRQNARRRGGALGAGAGGAAGIERDPVPRFLRRGQDS